MPAGYRLKGRKGIPDDKLRERDTRDGRLDQGRGRPCAPRRLDKRVSVAFLRAQGDKQLPRPQLPAVRRESADRRGRNRSPPAGSPAGEGFWVECRHDF
jgi:hypothetical protein